MTTRPFPEMAEALRVNATVSVDGRRWRRLTSAKALAAAASDARVFILDPGSGAVRFGDGEHGARPPRGSRVRVSYRAGGGAASVTATWASEWPPRPFALAAALAPSAPEGPCN